MIRYVNPPLDGNCLYISLVQGKSFQNAFKDGKHVDQWSPYSREIEFEAGLDLRQKVVMKMRDIGR